MTHKRSRSVNSSLACLLAGACAAVTFGAQAVPLELIYTGSFRNDEALNLATDAKPTFFKDWTPFTIHAWFDDSSPNLAPPSPPFPPPFSGFRAYAPSSTTIDIAGKRYTIENILANPKAGVTVAIFDRKSFDPDHYAVGLLADPFGDGAGIVGDFLSASPDFVASAIKPTVFGDFFGVGHASGVCSSGSPPECPHEVTPLVLHDANDVTWNLTLGNFEVDYPVAHTEGASVGPLNTAQIVAVPEASTYALMLGGLAGMALVIRRRQGF
jgi:hypothetical protein